MSTRAPRAVTRVVAALALLAAALGLFEARKRFIAGFFVHGPGGAPPPVLPSPADPTLAREGVGPAARVRVVLLDGLGLAAARRLPTLSSLCADGLDLEVDVGFPTVSLPVQSVLWSGQTQQQTGIQFVGRKLAGPLIG